jgi:hypothetical protein
MGDPLIERYERSFLTKHPTRKAHEPLPASKLKKLSVQIQSKGKHPGIPPLAGVGPEKLPDPRDWVLPTRVPTTIHQQFETLKREELEQWKKITNELWQAEKAEYDILWELYEAMVTDEYAQLGKPGATWAAAFKEFEERRGIELYRELRPLYYRAKVREPHKFIMQMISSNVRLAGVQVLQGVHPKFADILRRVDRSINRSTMAQFGIQPVKYIGCFRPSPLGDRISNHMIGAAIDIDATIKGADRNPHLKKPQLDALELMLAFRAKHNPLPTGTVLKVSGSWLAGVPDLDALDRARALHAQTVQISTETKAFLDEFLDAFVSFQKTPNTLADAAAEAKRKEAFKIIEQLLKAFGGERGLRNIKKGGLISIPAEVFEALASDPDLQWGNYENSKDIMHFEIKRQADIIGANGFP